MNTVDILLAIAGVGYVMARRMMGQLLEVKSLLILPAVLTIIGATSLHKASPMNATTVAFIGVSIALSVVIGLVRGGTVHLGERDGELWMRYRVSTVALWVLNIALKVAVIPIERGVSHASSDAASKALLLSVGIGILAESAVVLLRAMPHSTSLVWEKDEKGAPHTTLPGLDRAQDRLRSTVGEGARLRLSDLKKLADNDRGW